MIEDEDLPDADFESIYGAEMLEARKRRRFRELEAMVADLRCQFEASVKRTSVLDEKGLGWKRPES